MTGLFSSSFSRLFKNQDKRSGVIRPRPDEESAECQPPSKRAKGMENEISPANKSRENTINHSQFMASLSNESGFETTMEPIAGPSYISERIQNTLSKPLTSAVVISKEKRADSEYTSGYSSMAKLCEKEIPGRKSGVPDSASKSIDNPINERKSLFNIPSKLKTFTFSLSVH